MWNLVSVSLLLMGFSESETCTLDMLAFMLLTVFIMISSSYFPQVLCEVGSLTQMAVRGRKEHLHFLVEIGSFE